MGRGWVAGFKKQELLKEENYSYSSLALALAWGKEASGERRSSISLMGMVLLVLNLTCDLNEKRKKVEKERKLTSHRLAKGSSSSSRKLIQGIRA